MCSRWPRDEGCYLPLVPWSKVFRVQLQRLLPQRLHRYTLARSLMSSSEAIFWLGMFGLIILLAVIGMAAAK